MQQYEPVQREWNGYKGAIEFLPIRCCKPKAALKTRLQLKTELFAEKWYSHRVHMPSSPVWPVYVNCWDLSRQFWSSMVSQTEPNILVCSSIQCCDNTWFFPFSTVGRLSLHIERYICRAMWSRGSVTIFAFSISITDLPSVLWHCWLVVRKCHIMFLSICIQWSINSTCTIPKVSRFRGRSSSCTCLKCARLR